MSSPETASRSKSSRRFPWRRILLVLVGGLVVLWFVHPMLLEKALRLGLSEAASSRGLKLRLGDISANLARPLVFEKVELRAQDSTVSNTAAEVERVEVLLNWPWRAFFGERRLFRAVTVRNLRGVFDLRSPSGVPAEGPAASGPSHARSEAVASLQVLPQLVSIQSASVEVLTGRQSYYLADVSAIFSEEKLEKFRASGAEVHVGAIHENLGTLEGVTAWNEGILYLAQMPLRDGLEIQNLEIQLARPRGFALSLKAGIFGGFLRGDVSHDAGDLDATLWATNVDVARLAALLGFRDKAEGVVREARFKFRGVPERALDGEASLRLVADEFRWNKRGWESLEIGASLINRRLAVSEFTLKQKENSLSGNGDLLLSENLKSTGRAPFTINATASIKDLGALAGLLGSPFDEMRGRMSLSSSISGEGGKLSGYLSMEGSGMGFRNRPIESGRVEVSFVNREAQVKQCEFWSDSDYLRGTGAVELASPHNYSGEIQGRLGDISSYLDLLRISGVPVVYAGAAQLRWQGDGTAAAHSGAFNVSLENFVSEQTPSGLTGRFAGTYSPQNVYFSGFELEQGRLRFSSRATLAASGVKFQDGVLQSGGREVAEAEVFVPINPFLLAAGKPLKEAMHADKAVYASISTRGALGVRDLLKLAGNDAPANGTVQLDFKATGPFSALTMDGRLAGRALAFKRGGESTPASKIDATIRAENGQAQIAGEMVTGNTPAANLKAEFPIAPVANGAGGLRWLKPDGVLAGRLDLPRLELAALKPFFPKIWRLSGLATGGVDFGGTAAEPQFTGEIVLRDGDFQLAQHGPVIGRMTGVLKFDGPNVAAEKLVGDVSGGPFELSGTATLGASPACDFTLTGRKLLLVDDPGLRVRADVDLQALGDAKAGTAKGSVRLLDGKFSRRLEVTPLLAPAPVEGRPKSSRFSDFFPSLFGAWNLDVSIQNETPFLITGNIASGEIVPDIRLVGTFGKPYPVGRVTLKNARAYLPFTTMAIEEGQLDFVEAAPWTPILNVKGTAQALDYEVQAFAFGPLDERRLVLRSEPPLSQEALILLLTTGLAPGMYAGNVPAQTGRLMLHGADASCHVDVETLFSRLPAALQYPAGRTSLRGRIDLWRGLSAVGDRDSLGLSGNGATYTLRLR